MRCKRSTGSRTRRANSPPAHARQRVELLLKHLAGALTDSAVSACIPALVHAADNDPAVRDFFHTYSAERRRRLTDTIAAGVADGEFPCRVDPDAASAALSGAMFYRRLMTAERHSTAQFITNTGRHGPWRMMSGGAGPVLLRRLEEFAGMGAAAVRLAQPGQHARQFGDAVLVVEAAHPA